MKKNIVLIIALLCIFCSAHSAQQHFRINIWEGIPQFSGIRVTMEITVPDHPNGTALIICPGGSYHHLGVPNEGRKTAARFSSLGVVSCVLKYRVSQHGYHYPAMMQDIQRAIQLMRMEAEKYAVNPHKIGVIGYSAGGHLAAWAGAFASRTDELSNAGMMSPVSLRPDFVIPVYPVVSMQDDIAHAWSRKSLIGKNPSQETKDLFSLELQIPDDMPPTYLVACEDDSVVDYENSVRLYHALQEKNIDCTFASYATGGHGFGMKDSQFMREHHWNIALEAWLCERGFLD